MRPSGRTFEPYAPDSLPGAHLDTVLQTTLEPEALDRSLRRIEEQARLSHRGTGRQHAVPRAGPAALHRGRSVGRDLQGAPGAAAGVAAARVGAIAVRPHRCRRRADGQPGARRVAAASAQSRASRPAERRGHVAPVAVPRGTGEHRKLPVARAEPRWRITNDIYLGLFSFQKLVMYKDLEANAAAVTQHRLVHQLITRRGRSRAAVSACPTTCGRPGWTTNIRPSGARTWWMPMAASNARSQPPSGATTSWSKDHQAPASRRRSPTSSRRRCTPARPCLFVAEKMAALDVVHQRLQTRGPWRVLPGTALDPFQQARGDQEHRLRARRVTAAAAAPGMPQTKLPDVRATLWRVRQRACTSAFGAIETTPFSAYWRTGARCSMRLAPTGPAILCQVTQSALEHGRGTSAIARSGGRRCRRDRDTSRGATRRARSIPRTSSMPSSRRPAAWRSGVPGVEAAAAEARPRSACRALESSRRSRTGASRHGHVAAVAGCAA